MKHKGTNKILSFSAILILFLAAGLLTTSGSAFGGAVHHEVVDMAYGVIDREHYAALANLLETTYQGAIDSGAVFPDMGYGRPADQDYWAHLSEDAHSDTFEQALIDYLMPTFRRLPGSEDDRRKIAFLYGVIAHHEADNPSHFGRDGLEGFIPAAIQVENGNDEQSIEVGCDVFANVEYGQGGSEDAWWTPYDAVQAAYHTLGHDVVPSQVEDGMLAIASLHSVMKAYPIVVYWSYLADINWTHGQLLIFPVGGMQDGANQTAAAWQRTWDWMSTYRVFMPNVSRDTGSAPTSGPEMGANIKAAAGQSTAEEPRRPADAVDTERMMALGHALIDEGAVKVVSHWEDKNFIIDRVEIVDLQRAKELANEMLGIPTE